MNQHSLHCICLTLQNAFVSNFELHFSHITNCICHTIAICICLKLLDVLVSHYKLYLSQITNCICLTLLDVLVSICKLYLSQIAKCSRERGSGVMWKGGAGESAQSTLHLHLTHHKEGRVEKEGETALLFLILI